MMSYGQCAVPGCHDTELRARGYCTAHYERLRKYGTTDSRWPAVCQVPGCSIGGQLRRGMCYAHYLRWRNARHEVTST